MNREDFDQIIKALDALVEIEKSPDGAYCPSCQIGRLEWQDKEHFPQGGHWVCDGCKRWFQQGFSYSHALMWERRR